MFTATFVGVRFLVLSLPAGLGVRHLAVLAFSVGVGFTMSLFIAQLAFTDAGALIGAKVSVLVAGLVSGLLALLAGRALLSDRVEDEGRATSADEAEQFVDR